MSRRPRDAASSRFRVTDGSRLKSLESEMQQVEGEYQSALCPECFMPRTLPNCMPPRMTGDSCRP